LGIQIPNSNIITNNITTTSSKQFDNKDNFNTNEKINNIEASFSIYNIIQKNVNKNLNIIDGKENLSHNNLNRSFCNIF
jgi:molybdopterin-binding protein